MGRPQRKRSDRGVEVKLGRLHTGYRREREVHSAESLFIYFLDWSGGRVLLKRGVAFRLISFRRYLARRPPRAIWEVGEGI